MNGVVPAVESFSALASWRASLHPDRVYGRSLAQDLTFADRMTYGGLDRAARSIAAALPVRPGDRVLLVHPPGLGFMPAFLGCLYAGVIAVPVAPPEGTRTDKALARLMAIIENCGASAVLGPTALREKVPLGLPWIATDDVPEASFDPVRSGPGSVALLQYTSGSTGTPKGVRVTHGNLLHNSRIIAEGFEHTAECRGINWLPPWHDMGLVGCILQPLAVGGDILHMAPLDFLRRPVRWLQAIDRYGPCSSGGPDFAWRLCTEKVTDAEIARLDLSKWRVAFSGAEPVRAATLRAFAERFAPCGFRKEAFYPTYGLAEATLFVTGGRPLDPLVTVKVDGRALEAGRITASDGDDTRELVGCGYPGDGVDVRIVDPVTREELGPDRVGEIWVAGPSVTDGYWNRDSDNFNATLASPAPSPAPAPAPERPAGTSAPVSAIDVNTTDGGREVGSRQSAEPARDASDREYGEDTAADLLGRGRGRGRGRGTGGFLRTGDLGVFRNGRLFVTGRIKDLVIVRGRNLYPHDVEDAVESCHPAIRTAVAFGLERGEEVLAVAVEANENADLDEVIDAVRSAVGETFGLSPGTVVIAARGQIGKTTSGKPRRYAWKQGLLDGSLVLLRRWDEGARRLGGPADGSLADRIAAVVGEMTGRTRIDRAAPFSSLGIDSVRVVDLTLALEEQLGRPVPTIALYEHSSVDALAAFLEGADAPVPGEASGVYADLDAARAKIDARSTAYQFDPEKDVPWDRIGEPGLYLSPRLLHEFGVDVDAIRAVPDAWALLQWAMALQICVTFELLELSILFFAHREKDALGASRSVDLLVDEEQKHIELFRRYARHLRAERPTDAVRLDVLAADTYDYVRTGIYAREVPSRAAYHYMAWLRILFFEEYTVHLHRRLDASEEPIQPTWLAAHGAHRKEEQQHIATDCKHLDAVALGEDDRRSLSALLAHDLLRDYERQFAIEGARRLVEERFPGIRVLRDEPGLAAACTTQLLKDKTFVHSRGYAPMFAAIAEMPPELAPRACRDAAASLLGEADRGEEPIAIVGMACRVPGGVVDPEGLWRLLAHGVDAITEVPASRWDVDALYDPDPKAPGKMTTRWGGWLDDIEQFDAGFFGIAPREAKWMDPQQRLLLETSWEALEDAAIPPESLGGTQTGVYVGLCARDYMHRDTVDPIDGWTVTGTAFSVAAGRISYLLGLHGPSLAVDTACSSGLVALHLAVQSIRRGESQRAVVGSANLVLVPESTICFSQLRAMSPVGRCKTFDATADGYVRSEGVVSFVLEPLSVAIREGHRIHAVIRGTAVNQDGRSNGLTAPNGAAQQEVIRTALADAGLTAADVGYVEAHGTGTALGDPIELAALGEVLRSGHPTSRPVPVGSIKTNVGHSEGVSGLLGMMKAVLCLKYGAIPPHLHVAAPTPKVDWSRLPMRIPTSLEPWPAVGVPRVAGVSSFGFGGTNAHAIVEEAPPLSAPAGTGSPVALVALSAMSEAGLRAQASRWADHLARHPELSARDVGYTSLVGRTAHRFRLAVVGDRDGVIAGLGDAAAVEAGDPPTVAFLFTGQGAQWAGMGAALYERFAAFRAVIDQVGAAIDDRLPAPIRALVCDPAASVDPTACAQPALFALELGVAAIWRDLGVEATAVLGHSVGEIAAACFAGAMTIEEGARLVAARGALMQALPAGGAMVSIAASEADVRAAIAAHGPGGADVAAINAADQVVVSGDEDAVAAIAASFARRGVATQRLVVSHAFHSHRLDPMLAAFGEVAATIPPRTPAIPVVSNTDGGVHGEIAPPYWVRHARSPVRFADGLATLLGLGAEVLLEVGPQAILTGLASRTDRLRLPSVRRGRGVEVLLESAGKLWSRGARVDGAALYAGTGAGRVGLPTTVFQKQRYWTEEGPKLSAAGGAVHPLVGASLDVAGRQSYEALYGVGPMPWLGDHRVGGRVVVPATAFLEALRGAAAHARGGLVALEEVRIEQALPLTDAERRRVQINVVPSPARPVPVPVPVPERPGVKSEIAAAISGVASVESAEVTSETPGPNGRGDTADRQHHLGFQREPYGHAHGRGHGSGIGEESCTVELFSKGAAGWVRHASARVADAAVVPEHVDLAAIEARCPQVVDVAALYAGLAAAGLGYGPSFQAIRALRRGADEAIADLQIAASDGASWPPALVDAALQAVAILLADEGPALYLPIGFDRVAGGPLPASVRAIARVHRGEAPSAAFRLVDADGAALLAIDGLRLARTAARTRTAASDGLYAQQMVPVATPDGEPAVDRWLVLGDGELAGTIAVELLASRAGLDADLDAALADVDGVILVAPETGEAPGVASRLVNAGAELARAIGRSRRTIRPILVTRGALATDERTRTAPGIAASHAALWGFGRTWAQEQPTLSVRLVDLDPAAGVKAAAKALITELGSEDREDQVAWRGDQRTAARLVEAVESEQTPVPNAPNDTLDLGARGRLDTLRLVPAPRPSAGPGQVVVEVEAAGLNFRDVLNALGMYKGAAGPLGGECAGRIVEIGPGVRGLALGDAVMGMAPAAFGRFVATDARLMVKRPAGLSAEEAATVPIAFATAWYGLFHLAKLRAGERVLVHAAAGGVGMAAVQLALRAGAEVIGTASAGKQDLVRELGVDRVYDSRDPAFAEAFLRDETKLRQAGRTDRATNGAATAERPVHPDALSATDSNAGALAGALAAGDGKVQVVLNALTGAFIPASLRLLGPGGRFLEMGKAEIWDEPRLRAVHADAAYTPFDLVEADPDVLGRILRDIADGLARGELRPLPRRTFPITRSVDAFRYMAQARHVGKVVLSRGTGEPSLDGTWLVTGASGAIGKPLCRWLVDHGVRRLVLLGRTPVREDAPWLVALREVAEVRTYAADVADPVVVREIVASEGPLRGVVHAAGVLDDATLAGHDAARIERVLRPKVDGAWALHEATLGQPLQAFVMLSSAAAWLGSAGQAAYTAANAFLDGLARARHARGLPATSVGYGPWADGGMADRLGAREQSRLSAMGIGRIAPASGLVSLGEALRRGVAEIAVLPVDRERFKSRLSAGPVPPLLSALAGPSRPKTGALSIAIAALEHAPPKRRHAALVDALRATTAQALGLPSPDAVDPHRPLRDLGLDSLMAIDLHNALSAGMDRALPETLLFDHPTLDDLARHLVGLLGLAEPASQDEEDADLTLAEASRLLADELRELEDLL